MSEALLKKLKFKDGPAVVLNAPEGYTLGIEKVEVNNNKLNFLQIFVEYQEELIVHLEKMIPNLMEDAIVWITYPKQSSKTRTDLNRDIIAAIVQNKTEYRVVSSIAVDDKWSGLRIRRKDKVKTKK